tara:strand:- start:83 stop:529 length:447 start_codon:yes stop_codon:yes gene_type:complete
MNNILYKILRDKGYTSRECEYALNRYKGRMFADWVRELNFNTLSKSKLEFYRIDSEWHIKWLRDQSYKGTKAYQGIAYFWSHKYKHHLRDCTPKERRRVHDLFLKEELVLYEETAKHDEIMNSVFKTESYNQEPEIEYELIFKKESNG